ncbi:M48 family metallopeptidase [Taibaiella soli]|uniref:M48 family peptidase n=1 Tax=Taibaiella soli TaxID=1649169 RepID=A0A2W2ADW8_9BACT|nr:M48 family metallopeptidase [Taibaiella soli]PZF73471.1 M48 family peptidase [Taibaiella soli]
MKKIYTLLSISLVIIMLTACYKNPVTGRKSINLVDESTMNSLSAQQYATFLSSNPTVSATSGNKDAEMVTRVGNRMAAAITEYLRSKGQENLIKNYKWEFNLVNNKEANAWCMPGGKVVVYTGIMPIVQNETSLAVVMGHEIAHAIARHGDERMSQELMVEAGGTALSVAMASQPGTTQSIFNQVYGVGGQLGTLAYSRKHESEADHMGLIFMAIAGYNPSEAVGFWQRMATAASSSQKPPAFLSTHPSDQQRIQQIQQWLPEAMKYYKPQK